MRNRYFKVRLLLAMACLVGLLAGTQEASAQYAGSMGRMYNTISFASQSISISQNHYYETLHRGQKLGAGPSRSSSAPSNSGSTSNAGTAPNTEATNQAAAPRQYQITATDFTPSSNRIVPDQLVNEIPNLSAEQKNTLRNAYNQTLSVFETKIRKNNLGSSFAFLLATSQQIAEKRQVSGQEMMSLVDYYNNVVASSPEIGKFSGQQKQALNESLILTAATMDALYTKGVMEKDPAMQKQAMDMAKSYVKTLTGKSVQ